MCTVHKYFDYFKLCIVSRLCDVNSVSYLLKKMKNDNHNDNWIKRKKGMSLLSTVIVFNTRSYPFLRFS